MDRDALVTRLARHVGLGAVAAERDEYPGACVDEALALVAQHIAPVPSEVVPDEIQARAVIECAADLYWRKQARNGVATFDSEGALETVRIGLDPMRSARALLDRYLGPAIA